MSCMFALRLTDKDSRMLHCGVVGIESQISEETFAAGT